jgi:TRAP-type mannitol/chloroaromatic compound transport system substrate-binding protein
LKRRSLVRHAGMAGILAGLSAPAVQAQAAVRWRLGVTYHPSLDVITAGTELFARQIQQISGGRLQVTLVPSEEPPVALAQLQALQHGELDALHAVPSHFVSIDECFALDSAIPFGLNSRQMSAWMLEGNGSRLLREFYAQHQVVNFPMGNSGAQLGGWFRRELQGPSDLEGLRMQIGGLGARVMQSLGAVPQLFPTGEVVAALERGQIDGAEWVGPHDDRRLGLGRAVRHCYYPGWWEGGAQLSLYCGAKAWRNLSPDFRLMVELAAQSAHAAIQARYDLVNPLAFKQLVAAGARIKPFPPKLVDAAFRASNALYSDLSQRNPAWRRIYSDFAAFRREQNLWHRVCEATFDRYMQAARL